jgi:hypothetical protein
MKYCTVVAVAFVLVADVQGFAPVSPQGQLVGAVSTSSSSTQLQGSIFDAVAGMDLFAPKKDQNAYGARNKKDLSIGKIQSGKSYVPDGLTASQYDDIRQKQVKRKADNYARNVAKAGVFEDYTDFYTKRGTDLSQDWAKNKNTLGHRFAKTKFDWAGVPGKSFLDTTASQVGKKKPDEKKKPKISGWSFGGKKK